jgi:NitT/TauT family transport system substrate-binding protein
MRSLLLLILSVLGLTLVACAPAAPVPTATVDTPASTPPPVKVTVGRSGASGDWPVYIALERGYFRAEGVDVDLVPFTTAGDMIAPLASGQLLVGTGGVSVGLFNAVARGVPIRVVADKSHVPPDFTGTGWVVRQELLGDGSVKAPRDIKGLTIGIGSRGSVIDTELDVLLQKGGLTREEVTLKDVAHVDQVAAFANKSIDVAYSFEPYINALVDQGFARMWIPSGQLIPYHEQTVILYSPVFAEQYPEAARRWMVAYIQGVRDFIKAYKGQDPPDDVVAALIKHGNEKDPAKVRASRPSPINPDGYALLESLQTDLDFFVRAGLVTTPPNLTELVDSSFVDYAIARLGRFQP